MKAWKQIVAAVATSGTMLLSTPAAFAVPEPDMSKITAEVPTGDVPKPLVEMEQTSECQQGGQLKDVNINLEPPISKAYHVNELHSYATGKGVTVAIIDSGVTPNSRLKNLTGGGDYVMGEDGLKDCDRHGTLLAGIIAAQPSEKDKFVGIAPDVNLISIRQTSAAFEPKKDEDKSKATSTLATLAGAIVRATNLGADVINMSVTSCYAADQVVDTNDLKAAIAYAYQHNVVLVTAAGNADATDCTKNPGYVPNNPRDYRNWKGVTHLSMPSYYTPNLISVGGATLNGQVYTNTMTGPWIDVAAPAERVTSLDPAKDGELINASKADKGELNEITGTSFASAYISGLAALIIEKYPEISPSEVAYKITSTAKSGTSANANSIGAGVVDPVAALTSTAPHYKQSAGEVATTPHVQETDPYKTTKIVVGSLAVLCLILAAVAGSIYMTKTISGSASPKRNSVGIS